MSSRFLIPVLCVAAVAFACGPRARNEASTPKKDSVAIAQSNTGAPVVAQQGAPRRREPAQKIGAELYVRTNGGEITFALHVVNNTKKKLEVTFPSGQTHDFVVVDSVGREVWRWGNGRMFTQTLRNTLLGGGETMEFEERLDGGLQLNPGRYTARARLTSANYPLEREAEFTIHSTTLAAK